MKRFVMLCLMFGLALSWTSFEAEARRGRGGHENFKMMRKALDQLDLSEEQKKQVAEVQKSKKGEVKGLRAKKRKTKEAYRSALSKDASESEIRRLHKEMQALRSQISNARFEKLMALRKVLTPDQRKKFYELLQSQRKMRKGKRGRGPDFDEEDDD